MAKGILLLPLVSVVHALVVISYVAAISLDDFYPYGFEVKDELMGRIDDGFGPTINDTIMVCKIKH